MIRALVDHRLLLSLTIGASAALLLARRFPFPEDAAILDLVAAQKPALYWSIRWGYLAMLFTTPFLCSSAAFSLLYIFVVRQRERATLHRLPLYPVPARRESLFVVVGEIHLPKRAEPSPNPRWLTIPERGLFTGIAVFGAIGSGKTSCCMYPFAEQILAFRSSDASRRIGGLILEVKGDFCRKAKRILENHGRGDDYVEVAIDGEFRYNPLHNDLEAYALAYGIASLLNNLFGKGKEPFWQQAYTNLVKFVILLHKVNYDYVTLFDVYECAINPERLESRIRDGERLFHTAEYVLITVAQYMEHRELTRYPFERDGATGEMKAPISADLLRFLDANRIAYSPVIETGGQMSDADDPVFERKRQQLEAVKRWFYHDWRRIEPKLRTSIVEGISVFLSLFDDNPSVKRTFCPPKECYDPSLNSDGRFGKPLPGFGEMIEAGKLVALDFPVAANPGLARAIGTLMKQDFQRAVLNRIPAMERAANIHWREVLFLCDEYQSFATVGESDPTGDEKFFALSRQAKCIPIVATQSISSLRSTLPGESWRTLLQTFRTKIFLAVSDDFSMRTASELCGKEEQLKLSYSLSESDHDARVSVLTGRATAHRAAIGTSKSYNLHRDWVFEPKVFGELKNAQAIVLAYDGLNPHPPSYCYLKPYYLDPNRTYFEQLAAGEI